MAALEKGITRNGTGYSGKTWNILGQVYFPKAVTDSTFAFETNSDPGQFVPVHIHPTQDEFILVQDGMLDLKLDGVWVQAKAGDLVRLPRGIPHGYFNKSDKPARALFWVSPTQKLEALFNQLHNLSDVAEIVRISGRARSELPAAGSQRLGRGLTRAAASIDTFECGKVVDDGYVATGWLGAKRGLAFSPRTPTLARRRNSVRWLLTEFPIHAARIHFGAYRPDGMMGPIMADDPARALAAPATG